MIELCPSRAELAESLARRILLNAVGSAASSGLLLVRPQADAESTFIACDLQKALAARGALVLYANLGESKPADAIIAGSICGSIQRLLFTSASDPVPCVAQVVSSTAGVTQELIGIGKRVSLCTAFVALSELSKRLIVLVVEGVQHASEEASGTATLCALKAARDELNSSKHHGLRIVLVGYDRDDIKRLCTDRDQAFFGAPMIDLPL